MTPDSVSFTFCNLCDAICGLEVEHYGREVKRIRGDTADPFSHGHICPKGSSHKDLLTDPDRLRNPLRRTGNDWSEISWREAIGETAERLADAQRRGGKDSAAIYYGNPIGHNYQAMLALLPFIKYLGSHNTYSSNSIDAYPRMLVSVLLYGNQALIPIPDIERTDFLVVMGANPIVSHGSAMGAPDTKRRLQAIRNRGGKIVVIDPRMTETSAIADRHIAIQPSTDAFLLLALIGELNRAGLIRLGHLSKMVTGLDEVLALASEFTPRRVAPITGIDEETISDLAADFASAGRACWYGRMGTCTQAFGSLTTWLIDVINIVTGRLDHPGGPMFTTPAVDLAGLAQLLREPGKRGRWSTRVQGLPEFNGESPVAALCDEIETPGRGQIRAMLVVAGNPAITNPESNRLVKGLAAIPFLACIDYYINETSRHADIIMPPATAFESDQFPVLEHSIAVRNTAHFAPALFEREAGTRHDWEILTALTGALARERGVPRVVADTARATLAWSIGSGRLLDVLLRLGPHKLTLRGLRSHPHGIDLGSLEPRLEKAIQTRDSKINLAPSHLIADARKLNERAGRRDHGDHELLMISRRTMKSMNSWLNNNRVLARGKDRCTLEIHPDDATTRGLTDGDVAIVGSETGEIEVPVTVTTNMMPGVVSMPFGWGHNQPGTRLSIAADHAGANMNEVVSARIIDEASGTSVVNGIPVTVESAAR